jgi:hypothetical protein
MTHTCHARGCTREVDPSLLMCLSHWKRVPKPLQHDVWRHYRKGQELDRNPSREYLAAANAAIEAVERAEFGGRLL